MDIFSDEHMYRDLFLQAILILITIFMFLYMYNIPQKYLSNLRLRNRSNIQSRKHFVQGAQLLSQAKSAAAAKQHSASAQSSSSLAKLAEEQADLAISLDSSDAASYILKALALDMQGMKTSALDSIDVALSPPAVKSLSEDERAEALFKRAQLRSTAPGGVSRRVDSVIEDLNECVRLKGDNVKAYCLLGDCYEKKGMKIEAKLAYLDALRVQPDFGPATEAIDRLNSES
ncbi:hypothetical protein P3S68_027313 [Capsicum galapagoense]